MLNQCSMDEDREWDKQCRGGRGGDGKAFREALAWEASHLGASRELRMAQLVI